MRTKMLITIGLSGSGKSTFSKEYVRKDPSFVRVNRDGLRRQIMGEIPCDYYKGKCKDLEDHITAIEYQQIRYWLTHGKNVIVDNTHLQNKYIDKLVLYFGGIAEIEFKVFDTSLEECKRRVKLRDGDVDVSYMDRQYKDFKKINIIDGMFQTPRKFIKPNITGRKAIIVDLDGTLADCTGIRSPYDGNKLCDDRLIKPVSDIIRNLDGNTKVIYMSGREDKWRDLTLQWLDKHRLLDNFAGWDLLMRTSGDMRDDAIIKRELYIKNVYNKYDINFVIDDRIRVLWMWEDLGMFVINVNQGNKWF